MFDNATIRRTMQTFVSHIAWESEVWIAEDPDQITANLHQSRTRATLRDPDQSGLPKLLSGELGVAESASSISKAF